MRHWQPRIATAVEQALADGVELIVGLVLALHWSTMSIARYRELFEAAVAGRAATRFVERWGSEPGFVDLLASRVRGTDAHVVFTAHSLPARVRAVGDPYEDELLETSRLVAAGPASTTGRSPFRAPLRPVSPGWSRDILEHLAELQARGVRRVLLCPIGFVSEHLEIRWDLDVEASATARARAGPRRIELPNADPAFVEVLAAVVRRHAALPSAA